MRFMIKNKHLFPAIFSIFCLFIQLPADELKTLQISDQKNVALYEAFWSNDRDGGGNDLACGCVPDLDELISIFKLHDYFKKDLNNHNDRFKQK